MSKGLHLTQYSKRAKMKREINEYDLPLMAMSKEASRAFDGQINVGMATRCPKCGSKRITRIIWGDFVYFEGLI